MTWHQWHHTAFCKIENDETFLGTRASEHVIRPNRSI